MKTCAVCGKPLRRLHSFRMAQGKLCPECYRKASLCYRDPVVHLTLDEVKMNIAMSEGIPEDFEISEKIGPFLGIDRKHGKFAVFKSGGFGREFSKPAVWELDRIVDCRILADETKEMSVLSVEIRMVDGRVQEIVLAARPIRTSGFAFSQSMILATRMKEALEAAAGMKKAGG